MFIIHANYVMIRLFVPKNTMLWCYVENPQHCQQLHQISIALYVCTLKHYVHKAKHNSIRLLILSGFVYVNQWMGLVILIWGPLNKNYGDAIDRNSMEKTAGRNMQFFQNSSGRLERWKFNDFTQFAAIRWRHLLNTDTIHIKQDPTTPKKK